MNKDEVALELYRLGVLDRVQQMVNRAEWDWDDAVIEVLSAELRRQRAIVEAKTGGGPPEGVTTK